MGAPPAARGRDRRAVPPGGAGLGRVPVQPLPGRRRRRCEPGHPRPVYLRCAPGETNPLYPTRPTAPGSAGRRAVRADDRRPPLRDGEPRPLPTRPEGPNGIWVVSRWATTAPFAQADPRVAEAEATARLEEFLAGTYRGRGRRGVRRGRRGLCDARRGPAPVRHDHRRALRAIRDRAGEWTAWPYGEMEFKVRLFADGGETVVEQLDLPDAPDGRSSSGRGHGDQTDERTASRWAAPLRLLRRRGDRVRRPPRGR